MKTIILDDLTHIGFIVKPYGFKGELIIGLESLDADDFPNTGYLFIRLEGLPVPFKIKHVYSKNGHLIIAVDEINNEAAAKPLNGLELYLDLPDGIDNNNAPSFEELVGYSVIDDVSGPIGIIASIEELPMQLIAQCIRNGQEILFPLNESIVHTIETEARIIRVNLPDGLIDVYS